MEKSLTFLVSPERITGEEFPRPFDIKIDGKWIKTQAYLYWEISVDRGSEPYSCNPFTRIIQADVWSYTEVKRIARFLNEFKIPLDTSKADLNGFCSLAIRKELKRQCDIPNAHIKGMSVADYRIQMAKNTKTRGGLYDYQDYLRPNARSKNG